MRIALAGLAACRAGVNHPPFASPCLRQLQVGRSLAAREYSPSSDSVAANKTIPSDARPTSLLGDLIYDEGKVVATLGTMSHYVLGHKMRIIPIRPPVIVFRSLTPVIVRIL